MHAHATSLPAPLLDSDFCLPRFPVPNVVVVVVVVVVVIIANHHSFACDHGLRVTSHPPGHDSASHNMPSLCSLSPASPAPLCTSTWYSHTYHCFHLLTHSLTYSTAARRHAGDMLLLLLLLHPLVLSSPRCMHLACHALRSLSLSPSLPRPRSIHPSCCRGNIQSPATCSSKPGP